MEEDKTEVVKEINEEVINNEEVKDYITRDEYNALLQKIEDNNKVPDTVIESITSEELDAIIKKTAMAATQLMEKNHLEKEVKIVMNKYSDFVSYKDEMIIIANTNPYLSVEEVYTKAKSYSQYEKDKKKVTQTTPTNKPTISTESTAIVTDTKSIINNMMAKLKM